MSSNIKGNFAVNSADDIMKIPDLITAVKLMREWRIDARDIKTKDQAVGRLMTHWKQKDGKIEKAPEKPDRSGFETAVSQNKQDRQRLLTKYEEVVKYYRSLPEQYKQDLSSVFPKFEQTAEDKMRDLQKSDCTILVAGETASGKSSLINLLLGVSILPTNAIKCTSTVCELRKGKEGQKSAVVYHRSEGEPRRRQPVILDLSNQNGLRKLEEYITSVDPEEEESPFERIEIFWPFPMLDEGVVIVDTPGISDGGVMSKLMERYLSKSFGFIYVINSSNAGGVQKGRLQDFLRQVVHSSEEDFRPDATIFIGNKWDHIPERDKKAVRDSTYDKLSKVYPGLKEQQIYYISVETAEKAMQYAQRPSTEEHRKLLEGIEILLPASLKSNLNSHYKWLSAVMKRSQYTLKVAKIMAARTMEENRKTFDQLKDQMSMIERNAEASLYGLKSGISKEVDEVYKNVLGALRSRDVGQRLFDWPPQECPRGKDWKKVAKEASEVIAERIAKEVNHWERHYNIVHGLKEKIVKKFEKDFGLLEDQIRDIEGVLVNGEVRMVNDLHKSLKKQAPVKKLWKMGRGGSSAEDEDTVKGLGGAVGSAATLETSDRNVRNLFKSYNADNCAGKMSEATRLYLELIFTSQNLRARIERFFNKFIKGIDAVAKLIPDFVKADQQLLKQLEQQVNEAKDHLKNIYPHLILTCQSLQGQLDLFFVGQIMTFDYQIKELNWDQADVPIGSGSFADVYCARLKTRKQDLAVALKVCRDPLKENNVTDILLEDRTLRDLSHDNIVGYYGATFRNTGAGPRRGTQWIMILEFCRHTLKSKFVNEDSNNPAKVGNVYSLQLEAMKVMADFAAQILRGLVHLHSKDLVHRDIKLENILVNDNNVVKLTDVGLAKPQIDIAGSIVGSPVYMAPEVLLQRMIYDQKADIYSLAIVLWEMWYGMDSAEHIQGQLFETLEKAVKRGLRPSMSLMHKPPEDWANMIRSAWEYEPVNRPTAKQLLDFFEKFLNDGKT